MEGMQQVMDSAKAKDGSFWRYPPAPRLPGIPIFVSLVRS